MLLRKSYGFSRKGGAPALPSLEVDGPITAEAINAGALRLTEANVALAGGVEHNIAIPADASIIRFTHAAGFEVTGLTGGASGRVVFLVNAGASPGVIYHDVGSTAANRFATSTGATVNLLAGEVMRCTYDATISRWRPEVP